MEIGHYREGRKNPSDCIRARKGKGKVHEHNPPRSLGRGARYHSILHVDASFKNPKEMSEEQHRSLLAGENVQHIDILCMSHSICYMLLVSYYILYHGICQ